MDGGEAANLGCVFRGAPVPRLLVRSSEQVYRQTLEWQGCPHLCTSAAVLSVGVCAQSVCVCSITWSHCPVCSNSISLSPLALSTAASIIVLPQCLHCQCHSPKNGQEARGGSLKEVEGRARRQERQDEYVAIWGCTKCTGTAETQVHCKGQQCE